MRNMNQPMVSTILFISWVGDIRGRMSGLDMDFFSQLPSGSVVELLLEPDRGYPVFYMHLFVGDDELYGRLCNDYVDGQHLTFDEVVQKDDLCSVRCRELEFGEDGLSFNTEDIYYDSCDHDKLCFGSQITGYSLVHLGDGPVCNYIAPYYVEMEQLIDNGAVFYCDYMDQGLGQVYDTCEDRDEQIKTMRKNLKEDYFWKDCSMVGYAAGERLLVDLDEYNKIMGSNLKCSDRTYTYGLVPITSS